MATLMKTHQFCDRVNSATEEANKTNATAEESGFDTTFWAQGVLGAILVVVGICGNLIVIGLFRHRRLRSSIRIHANALALWDILLLAFSFFAFTVPALCRIKGHRGPVALLAMIFYPITNAALTGCVWSTVLMTADRYLAVCHPLKHRVWSTAKRRKVVVGLNFLAALLFNIPRCFEVTYTYCIVKETANITVLTPEVHATTFYHSNLYQLTYKTALQLILMNVGPIFLLIALTISMIITLHRRSIAQRTKSMECESSSYKSPARCDSTSARPHSPSPLVLRTDNGPENRNNSFRVTSFTKNAAGYEKLDGCADSNNVVHGTDADCATVTVSFRNNQDSVNKTRNRSMVRDSTASTNRLLFLIVAKFIVCYTLPTVIDLSETFLPSHRFATSTFLAYLVEISNLLCMLNSATNVLAHLLLGKRVRQELYQMVTRCCNCSKD